jgi:hypothetical protein
MLTNATASRESLEILMNKIVPQVKLRSPAPRKAVA